MATVGSPKTRRIVLVLCAVLLVAVSSAFSQISPHRPAPAIIAHRGGPLKMHGPTYAEESLATFAARWARWHTTLELDVRLTSDGVPVVLHDPTLDRTTTCRGPVSALTWQRLEATCRLRTIGTARTSSVDDDGQRVASLQSVLTFARRSGARLMVELKSEQPHPPLAYARTVLRTVQVSRVRPAQLTLESFWPSYLDLGRKMVPGAQTSWLTRGRSARLATVAADAGYTWWSPKGPVQSSAVGTAHARGVKVVPWTLDSEQALRNADDAGVDAVLTDDPELARAVYHAPLLQPAFDVG